MSRPASGMQNRCALTRASSGASPHMGYSLLCRWWHRRSRRHWRRRCRRRCRCCRCHFRCGDRWAAGRRLAGVGCRGRRHLRRRVAAVRRHGAGSRARRRRGEPTASRNASSFPCVHIATAVTVNSRQPATTVIKMLYSIMAEPRWSATNPSGEGALTLNKAPNSRPNPKSAKRLRAFGPTSSLGAQPPSRFP